MRIALSRQPGTERDVSPLELFLDPLHLFAIGQVSHHLIGHVDLRTGTETVIPPRPGTLVATAETARPRRAPGTPAAS
jgi:hypothetical protein